MTSETIELVVDEPVDGQFYWILRKRDERRSEVSLVETADSPQPTYGAAMMDGIAALQRRADARGEGALAPMVTVVVDRV